jgi:hypothetical protein
MPFKRKARPSARSALCCVKKKDKYRGLTVALTKIFVLGFENIKVNAQNVFFLNNGCFVNLY